MYLKCVLWLVFRDHAMSIGVHLFYLIWLRKEVHAPGPGAKLSPQTEGKLSLLPIVKFFIFSFPRRLYSPGPGLCVWLKIDTDLQSALPCPRENPCFGLFWKSDVRVYLSGEGTGLLLSRLDHTWQYLICLRIQKKGRVCWALKAFNRRDWIWE